MTAVRVLETNILHASDVIYWLDGSSAADQSEMERLDHVLSVTLDTFPADMQLLHTPGKTALWRKLAGSVVPGVAAEAVKEKPAETPYSLSGTVSDVQRRFISRRFEIQAGGGLGQAIVLYPTPFGTRLGRGGALRGTLRFDGSETPVVWALLTLTVNLNLGATLVCRAQSDAHGDFIIALHRLPPLPQGTDRYSATLSIQALADARPEQPVDPTDLVAMNLGELTTNDSFAAAIDLSVVPGEIALIRSSNRHHLAVQPT